MAPKYNRRLYPHWSKNLAGLNTRQYLLNEYKIFPENYQATHTSHGSWYCQWSGNLLLNPEKVSIDHLVPLRWAHYHGAWRWPKMHKQLFANDFQNLTIMDVNVNCSKQAYSPLEWLPFQNKIKYIFSFEKVVLKYNLQYTPQEAQRMHGLKWRTLYSMVKNQQVNN